PLISSCEPTSQSWYHLATFLLNDTATTESYSLSLHDALPIYCKDKATLIVTMLRELGIPSTIVLVRTGLRGDFDPSPASLAPFEDRKSTRLNSSHVKISYAVFCLKKKKKDLHGVVSPCANHRS